MNKGFKRYRTYWFVVFFFCLSLHASLSFSQESVSVEISRNKVSIDGKVYYVHIVKAGQTLYSISRAYKVSQSEIIKANPGVQYNLQVNAALKIPVEKVKQEHAIQTISPNLVHQKRSPDFIYHKVDSGQTVYRLSKMYNVSIDTIYYYNPSTRTLLETGSIVKVPRIESVEMADETLKYELKEKFIYHEVKRKETLWGLAHKYGIDTSTIIRNNKELVFGLKAGQVIKIPRYDSILVAPFPEFQEELSRDTLFPYYGDILLHDETSTCDSVPDDFYRKKFDIALFLPFYNDRLKELAGLINTSEDEAEVKWAQRKFKELRNRVTSYIDYYLGVLLALDTLKKDGLSVNLHVYDVADDTSKIIKYFSVKELRKMDLFIGPVYNQQIEIAQRYALKYKIPIVPIPATIPQSTPYRQIKENPFYFNTLPSFRIEVENISKYISTQKNKSLVFVLSPDTLRREETNLLKNSIFKYLSYNSDFDSTIFKECIYNDKFDFEHVLSSYEENLLIIPSEDEAFVSDIISNLYFLGKDYDITVFGLPKWQKFTNIDLNYLSDIQVQFYTPFYVDYQDKTVAKVVKMFRSHYSMDPYSINSYGFNYSLLGFDMSYYFLNALYRYGKKFYKCIPDYKPSLTMSDYQFKRLCDDCGFENISMSIISISNDLSVQKIKSSGYTVLKKTNAR